MYVHICMLHTHKHAASLQSYHNPIKPAPQLNKRGHDPPVEKYLNPQTFIAPIQKHGWQRTALTINLLLQRTSVSLLLCLLIFLMAWPKESYFYTQQSHKALKTINQPKQSQHPPQMWVSFNIQASQSFVYSATRVASAASTYTSIKALFLRSERYTRFGVNWGHTVIPLWAHTAAGTVSHQDWNQPLWV